MKQWVLIFCAGFLCLCSAADLHAAEPPSGVSGAIHLGAYFAGFEYGSFTYDKSGFEIDSNSSGIAVGSGGALQLGYVLDVGLELGMLADAAYSRAESGSVELSRFTTSLQGIIQYYFLPRDIWSPYLGLGLGAMYTDDDSADQVGFRLSALAGVVYLIGPAAALDVRGLFSWNVGQAHFNVGDMDFRGWTVGLQLGISLYM